MSFEPLLYLFKTLTVWHFVVWGGLWILVGLILPLRRVGKVRIKRLFELALLLASFYAIFALILGQTFGEKYPFAVLAPSALLIGFSFGALFFFRVGENSKNKVSRLGAAAMSVFSALFFGFCIWLFPKVIGFGLVDVPKLSWGVQL